MIRRTGKPSRRRVTRLRLQHPRTKDSYLAAHQAQIRGRRGQAKATGATRHDILIAYYHIVGDRVPFRELGADWQARRRSPEQQTRRLVRQLERLAHKVTLTPPDVATHGAVEVRPLMELFRERAMIPVVRASA